MEKVLYDPMIIIYYRDQDYFEKSIQIITCNASIGVGITSAQVRVNIKKVEEYLAHQWKDLKQFEKLSRDNKLGADYYIEAVYKGKHIKINLDTSNPSLSKEIVEDFARLRRNVYGDLSYICEYCQIGLDNISLSIEEEIKKLKPDTQFLMKDYFAPKQVYFSNLDEAYTVYKSVVKHLERYIEPLDKFGTQFLRIDETKNDSDVNFNDFFNF